MKYILALDQGTTSSRAILFDSGQNIAGIAQKPFAQLYPREGWVEHDPMEIYASTVSVMGEVVAKSGVAGADIAAIGITNQRETTIMWDKNSGHPIYNAIVWQCRRTAPLVDQLIREGYEDYIKKTTGLVPDAYFSATKIKWILDNTPGAREKAERGEVLFGTVDTWLIWKLTGGIVHVTDYTNAARTMLFDIHKLRWDEELLKALGIPKACLPRVCKSSEIVGSANVDGDIIPIAGLAGDQQAALFGQCCFEKGEAKNTYGTGCFLLMNTGDEAVNSKNGLLVTLAAGTDNKPQYALEGSVFVAGAVVDWLRDELGIIEEASDTEKYARSVKDTGGVYVVPAFTGMGAPVWDLYARGAVVGLTRGSGRGQIIRAALESIAYQSCDLMHAMEKDTGVRLNSLAVDGGASANAFLMQFQADVLGCPVIRPACRESTALGAALLAGLQVGTWSDTGEIRSMRSKAEVFEPRSSEEERVRLMDGWHRAVDRCRDWAEHE